MKLLQLAGNRIDRITGGRIIELKPEQIERYKDQLRLPGMSAHAQSLLLEARVLILGGGEWAAAAAQYLVACGVGTIGLLDSSRVSDASLSNPILYRTRDIHQSKAQVFAKRLSQINSETRVIVHATNFDAHNAEQLIVQYSIILDGLQDWQDKLLSSDVCMHWKKRFVHCGCSDFHFQIFCMIPGKSACLRCAFDRLGLDDLESQNNQNNFLPITGMAGALQAAEAIKLISETGVVQADELIRFDALRREFDTVRGLSLRHDCPDCGRS